jgi:hypothetical protein
MQPKKPKSKSKPKPEPKSRRGNIFDAFVKRMFGQLLVFVDFLLNYADAKFVAAVDLSKIKPAPTHYIGQKGDERIVDLIFMCPLKNGRGNLMAVIIFEHQGGSLKKIPRKLLKYITAIWTAEEKEGKPLSAPYFIVIRTGKKPHRGTYPTMADSLPKDIEGVPVGKTVEIGYDVFDLPAWNFKKLVGGPVLRLALGILKTMTEDAGLEFSEAFHPLMEIPDEEQKIDLVKEVLPFIAEGLAARGLVLDTEMVNRALKPIFKGKDMIKTIFDEKYDTGFSEGQVDKGREMLLKILRSKFNKIPKDVEKTISKMNDPVSLDSWAEHALACQSMAEFAQAVRR